MRNLNTSLTKHPFPLTKLLQGVQVDSDSLLEVFKCLLNCVTTTSRTKFGACRNEHLALWLDNRCQYDSVPYRTHFRPPFRCVR